MCHTVIQFCELARVPTVRCSHEIARDALQLVDIRRATLRAMGQIIVGILVATIHTTVTVVVHRAVAHVKLVHHVHHAHDHLRIMGGVAVDLHIEDVSATRHLMIGSLHLSLMTGRALVIHGHMVRVGVVVTVRHALDDAKLLTVFLCELATQTFGRCSQHGVVVVVLLTEIIDTLTHIADNLQAQFLTFLALAVVLTRKGDKTFCQSDEADTKRTLIDHTLDSVTGLQLISTNPEALHQQGELLGEGGLLKLEAVVELLGCHLEHVVELGEEHVDTLLLVLLTHALDGELYDVDGRKRQVTTADAGPRSETVFEHAGTTTHRGHLVLVAFGIVGLPVAVLIIGGIEVQEVGEEPASSHLTSQLVEVEVTVLGQIVHATLLLPDLNGEDGRLATTHTFVGGEQDLTHDATTFCARVRTIINRREEHRSPSSGFLI